MSYWTGKTSTTYVLASCLAFWALSLGPVACGSDTGGDGDGDGGEVVAKSCKPGCESAEDCGENPEDWTCSDGACRENVCSTDGECIPELSGFEDEGCESGDCGATRTCIKYGETTYCAFEAATADSCPIGGVQEFQTADGNGMVSICVAENPRCMDGSCTNGESGEAGCTRDDQCRGGAICEDGECLCQSDADCPGGLSCNSAGECLCEEDEDCPLQLGLDKCRSDGVCVCTNDTSCSPLGPNYVCRK